MIFYQVTVFVLVPGHLWYIYYLDVFKDHLRHACSLLKPTHLATYLSIVYLLTVQVDSPVLNLNVYVSFSTMLISY